MKRFVFAALILSTLSGCGADRKEAEGYARAFARNNFPSAKLQHLQCQSSDSDGNGYVSCTLSLLENGKTRIQGLECAASWGFSFNHKGCRIPKVGM